MYVNPYLAAKLATLLLARLEENRRYQHTCTDIFHSIVPSLDRVSAFFRKQNKNKQNKNKISSSGVFVSIKRSKIKHEEKANASKSYHETFPIHFMDYDTGDDDG